MGRAVRIEEVKQDQVLRVRKNKDVGPAKVAECRKAPLTATGLFIFARPIALFSGRWLLLRANGKV